MAPWLSTHSPTACGEKVVAPATKGGNAFPTPAGRLYGFRRKKRYKKWRRRRRTSPAQRYYITPEGGALNPPVRRSRSQAEPLAPRAKGPAAPSTLTPVRACQPSGILESTAQVPDPIPTAPQAPTTAAPPLSEAMQPFYTTLGAQGQRPDGCHTPLCAAGAGPYGNTGKRRPGPGPDPDRATGAHHSSGPPERSDATFLHNPWHPGPKARWMPYAPLRRRRRPLREYGKALSRCPTSPPVH